MKNKNAVRLHTNALGTQTHTKKSYTTASKEVVPTAHVTESSKKDKKELTSGYILARVAQLVGSLLRVETPLLHDLASILQINTKGFPIMLLLHAPLDSNCV